MCHGLDRHHYVRYPQTSGVGGETAGLMALDTTTLKNALAHWASGVTVVTTQWQGENYGLTASSFTSVSLEPPLVSACLSRSLHTHDALVGSGVFAVSILASDQIDTGIRFAGLVPERGDRFVGLECDSAVTGCPIIRGCLAWLDCRVYQSIEAGDHSIIVGEVLAASSRDDGLPLLYYHRNWRTLD
jgi:flavin reductase (DIM6/NTAB) family NADH-FMN oxidoreductase RutF